jgi:limonene-1,2-epoxide hydrolase
MKVNEVRRRSFLVTAALGSGGARVLPFFAADVVYRPTETLPPVQGHEALGAAVKSWATTADRMEFRVLETFAAGPIVINRRIDQFTGSRPMKWEGTGVFFVKDGKIKEWSDYTVRLER